MKVRETPVEAAGKLAVNVLGYLPLAFECSACLCKLLHLFQL